MTAHDTTQRQAQVDDLVARMTLEEKLAQLVGLWVGADAGGAGVAPHQSEMTDDGLGWSEVIRDGLGQLTRPFGTAPVDPAAGARSLAASQAEIVAANRLGIPALVHEECLTGFAAWGATAYPVPLSWGASFDPELVEEMAARIGASMRAAGRAPGTRPGARRDARLPLGPHRGDDRRGPVPRRDRRHRLRPGPRGRGRRRHPEALRRLLGLPRRTQPGTRLDRSRASSPT